MDFKGNCRVAEGKATCLFSPCWFQEGKEFTEGKGDRAVPESLNDQEQW